MDVEGVAAKLTCELAQSLQPLAQDLGILISGLFLHHAQHDALQLPADIQLCDDKLVEDEQHQLRLDAPPRLGFDEMAAHPVGKRDRLPPPSLDAVTDALKNCRQHRNIGDDRVLVGFGLGPLGNQALYIVDCILRSLGEGPYDNAGRQPNLTTGDIGAEQLAKLGERKRGHRAQSPGIWADGFVMWTPTPVGHAGDTTRTAVVGYLLGPRLPASSQAPLRSHTQSPQWRQVGSAMNSLGKHTMSRVRQMGPVALRAMHGENVARSGAETVPTLSEAEHCHPNEGGGAPTDVDA
jgi:sirohydrochlorin ferrochelatase